MKNCSEKGIRAVLTVAALASLLRADAGSSATAFTLRVPHGRVWQTCLKPSEPLKWPWIEGSTAARLTVASLCEGKTAVHDIVREGNALYGAQALPELPGGSERLYDLTLAYMAEASVIRTETARVAVVPGVDGGASTLRRLRGVHWTKVDTAHPAFAYDADWAEGEASTVSLRQSVGGAAATTCELDGTSGYAVADAMGDSTTALTLLYDGVEAFTGACLRTGQGFLIILR